MKNKIVIVDYNVGNTNSVFNSIHSLGYNVMISNDRNIIDSSDVIILPGVGAFEEAMNNIKTYNLLKILENNVLKIKKPTLGICIGMQILANSSSENGNHKGLGWISGEVKKIKNINNIKIPHVGWNEVVPLKKNDIFFSNSVFDRPNFYWDHSYHFICDDKYKFAKVEYGSDITAIVGDQNIFGVQFHPEKSQTNGLRLFRSFFNYFNIK
jgi:glutamine amidotransferase